MKEFVFGGNRAKIPEALEFIRGALEEKKAPRKRVVIAQLAAEEILE